jgi:2-oxoacid:acceptor oxidoreductase gamma subunit (pyruvate/2-ketoisovalerate family)
MYEIRFHGRGGQGAVTAANILAVAAFKEGYDVQSFPFFGVERRGAPVEAYTRIDNKKIDIRMYIYNPDAVLVLDPSLTSNIDVTKGLKDGGIIVINSIKKPSEFDLKKFKIATVDATEIAVNKGLGSKAAPIVNTAILGAYAKAVGNVKIESIVEAVKEKSPIKADENAAAALESYEKTVKGW